MAHRHPSRLNAEHVTHAAARALLKSELANCGQCREEATLAALADLSPDGVLSSLLHGYVLARAEQWRTRNTRYPVNLHDLAPPAELRFLNIPTREVARLCVVESRAGNHITTRDALSEVALMSDEQRALVLDDLVDGLLETEG